MNDMTAVIVPKADQLTADDLLGGPITIKITKVVIKPGDQPVSISFEGDRGKPYKCCKSMARIMVGCWGPDANTYAGHSMTLYRDPDVMFGGMKIGGIRISHMTGLDGPYTQALTEKKGSKKLFKVLPLRDPAPQKIDPKVAAPVEGDPPPTGPSPADRAREYTDRFKARIKNCATVEAYNDIMGSETVGDRLADLKDRYRAMRDEIDIVCEDASKRLTGAPPIPERGPELVDDEIPF